jgi:hypothetical protein
MYQSNLLYKDISQIKYAGTMSFIVICCNMNIIVKAFDVTFIIKSACLAG